MYISECFTTAPTTHPCAAVMDAFSLLDKLEIPYQRVEHDVADTMEDCAAISDVLGSRICKNLVLTPRNRSAFYLLCLPGDKQFLTKDFSKQIGSSRLSFATAEDMQQLLGVQPGKVFPSRTQTLSFLSMITSTRSISLAPTA